ncbi:MAG: AAA family ATPase, partial [Acidimicrobiia bacterium]|nr:AAA family ATPase [Acidimicrobiia bacterium]
NSRSPHIMFLPEQIDVGFDQVHGMSRIVEDVKHTLTVLTNNDQFRNQMGGTPRRGILFEGPPGTGKTHIAKAMAKEAGVPFLFVSSTAFQSMWYGMTARKIRSYFKALRKVAREEGGVIGFIEEIDAIGMRRSETSESYSGLGVNRSMSSGTGGVVNELLIQMQSFDEPAGRERFRNWTVNRANKFLPAHRQFHTKATPYNNVLLVAATNRAASLDTALLRPGRFDRQLHFGIPGASARRELIDFFLAMKAHEPELDEEQARVDIASATLGYTPASLERLFDEALLIALRDHRNALSMDDVWQARTDTELGLAEPVDSPEHERDSIAIHEAGHATVAYLVGKGRRLEMLSIIKRREALGFLAHRMQEERHTQRRSELVALIQIALGGMVAEELFFGESGTGPGGDLAAATNAAVEMVGSLGMGDSLVSFRALDGGLLGGNLAAKVLSDNRARSQVETILTKNKERVDQLLGQHRHVIRALADALLERNELIGDEIIDVITAAERAHGLPIEIDLREAIPVVGPPDD